MALFKRIIPCLDVDQGRVVKGVKYVDHVDAGDPVEVAMRYDEQEADEITFLDITASHEERGILLDVVARTAESIFMPLTVGGGVRSLQDIRDLLNAGADKVSIMTAAIKNPDLVNDAAAKIGSANLVLAIDAKQVSADGESPRWEVFTHGGRNATGIDAVEWAARMAEAGAGEILLTSMDRDGTKSGYDLATFNINIKKCVVSLFPDSVNFTSQGSIKLIFIHLLPFEEFIVFYFSSECVRRHKVVVISILFRSPGLT